MNLRGRLRQSEIDELLDTTHTDDVYTWDNAMVLVPKSGTGYLIKGSLESLKAIKNSDRLCWKNKTNGQPKSNPRHFCYYAAMPDFDLIDEYISKVAKKNITSFQSAPFRKIITFDKESSTFIVEFVGNDSQYPWKKKSKHIVGTDVKAAQSNDYQPAEVIQNSSSQSHLRCILMPDESMKVIYDIDKIVSMDVSQVTIPFIFHYNTKSVSNHYVSILTLRDPTKKRISSKTEESLFKDATLPVGVMIHQVESQLNHRAFFQSLDVQLLKGKERGAFKQRPFLLVCDYHLEDIWPSAQTIISTENLKSTLEEMLKEKGLSEDFCDQNPVMEVFQSLLDSKDPNSFSELEAKIKNGSFPESGLENSSVRLFLLEQIVPKIRKQ